jgi:prophage maintenance system killer protein
VDGNQRLALGALAALDGINGRRLTLSNDAAYELIMQVAAADHLSWSFKWAACGLAENAAAT